MQWPITEIGTTLVAPVNPEQEKRIVALLCGVHEISLKKNRQFMIRTTAIKQMARKEEQCPAGNKH